MGGSARSEGTAERPVAVGSKAGQSAKKELTRGSKPVSSKGKRKGSEKTPKGGSGVSARLEKKEASAQNEGGPAEGQPGNQGQVVPPDLPGDPGVISRRSQAQAQPEAGPQAQVTTTS
jgi:hypothetical protein